MESMMAGIMLVESCLLYVAIRWWLYFGKQYINKHENEYTNKYLTVIYIKWTSQSPCLEQKLIAIPYIESLLLSSISIMKSWSMWLIVITTIRLCRWFFLWYLSYCCCCSCCCCWGRWWSYCDCNSVFSITFIRSLLFSILFSMTFNTVVNIPTLHSAMIDATNISTDWLTVWLNIAIDTTTSNLSNYCHS